MSLSVKISNPVVVAQAPASIREWGPWQFPEVERMADGRLHATFHIHKDSAASYGKPKAHALSADNGQTWERVTDFADTGGVELSNGDLLRPLFRLSVDASSIDLPEPVGQITSYGSLRTFYRAHELPEAYQSGWTFQRLPAGETAWKTETAQVHDSETLRMVSEGVLACFPLWRMKLAPNGVLWAITYDYRIPRGQNPTPRLEALFYTSEDNGHSWHLRSRIPYPGTADTSPDPMRHAREGFSEPDICFMPDGSLFCLLRTTDGNGIGPLYSARSTDEGCTWTAPTLYDNFGVWPTFLTLDNGVTLVTYGRTGLYIRATEDRGGMNWGQRIAIVPPLEYQTDTCSYADFTAIDDHTALLIYSDFNYPGPDGTPRKSILARTITVASPKKI